MQTETIIQERITFESSDLTLAGILAYPQSDEPLYAVLLCSPHPHFAGNMDNNVISELATDIAQEAVTLRFDYRGIGNSQIHLPQGLSVFDYWDCLEENENYQDAIDDVMSASRALFEISEGLPQTMAGYSFGAAMAFMNGLQNDNVQQIIGIAPPFTKVDFSFLTECSKPAFMVLGKDDFLYSPNDIKAFKEKISPLVEMELLEDCDHFFRGQEIRVAKTVSNFIKKNK
jgi:hypothetical protein